MHMPLVFSENTRMFHNRLNRSVMIALFGAAICLRATYGAAQTAPAAESGSGEQLQEIVVSAQRRQQNLQDVPIAVEAFTAADITNSVITSDTDLGMVTPGLVSAAQFGYFQPHLRGVGTTAPSASVESPVAVYVDGVYYGSETGSIFQLAGIERIEVDKGPQGTLFGRNATGGLIQIITKDPEQSFGGTASITAGDYRTLGGSLYVTGGLTPTIASNVSVYYQNQGQGYGRNVFNGEDVNKSQDFAIRQKTLFTPTDDDKVIVALDFEQNHSAPVLIPAPYTTPLGGPPYTGPRQGADGYDQPVNSEKQGGASVKVDHDFGFATLESITAWLRSSLYSSFDGTLVVDPAYVLNIQLLELHNQFTQEFDLRSAANSPITWTTGLYLYRSDAQYTPVTLTGGLIAPLSSYLTYSDSTAYSAALYAQASRELFDATTLTLGARYTWEEKYFDESQYGVYPESPPALFASVHDANQRYEKPTWRISLDHKLTADALVYASYNRGYKSGGFNDQILPVRTYAPETLDAYESGAKAAFLDRRFQVDTSAFYYNYSDIQVVSYPAGVEIIYNGAKAHIYGLDLDIKAIPFENFTISSGLEWMHATFTSFPAAQLSTPAPGGGTILGTFNAAGRHLPLAPDWTFDLTPLYTIPLGKAGKLLLSGTYSYNDGFFYEPDNRLHQGAYGLVNASSEWESAANEYSVRLWAKNLTNVQYTTAMYTQSNGDYAEYAPPRTFGVTLSHRF
ncbi:MAG TPA: TonB-dependent receptor [Steroidobacteraceae bacterium]|nr:TonB-dependent receptor [Steroidobacteraceae bacterium]